MTITTKTGDDGRTGLLGPGRVDKDDPRIEAFGAVDELNAAIGAARAAGPVALERGEIDIDINALLDRIQADLFVVGAALADPDPSGRFRQAVTTAHVDALERAIEEVEARLPVLTHFILPGGAPLAAGLHLARTICRRAERRVVALMRTPVAPSADPIIIYLNRLGDLLFLLARAVNLDAGVAERTWTGL